MRIAAIDIGTNAVLLLVAERQPDGSLTAVAERATITRLGEGVDRTGRLDAAAVARTSACIDGYAREIRNLGVERVAAVGTSAMRDAAGAEPFRSFVRATLGVDARVLSGEEEARLTFRGALSGLPLCVTSATRQKAVFDVGGGSTEVVLGTNCESRAELTYARSFDLGSVRLTERLVSHDPPAPGELHAIDTYARTLFESVPPLDAGTVPTGVAGTVTTLAAVALGLEPYDGVQVHGSGLSVQQLREALNRLASVNLAGRRLIRGMEPKRADVIVAGGIITLALLDHWGASRMVVSDRGVRWGLAEEVADLGPPVAAKKLQKS